MHSAMSDPNRAFFLKSAGYWVLFLLATVVAPYWMGHLNSGQANHGKPILWIGIFSFAAHVVSTSALASPLDSAGAFYLMLIGGWAVMVGLYFAGCVSLISHLT